MCGDTCRCESKSCAAQTSYSMLAFRKDNDETDYRRRNLNPEQLDKAVRWALGHDCDTILIELIQEPAASRVHGLTHHVCADPACPGGC